MTGHTSKHVPFSRHHPTLLAAGQEASRDPVAALAQMADRPQAAARYRGVSWGLPPHFLVCAAEGRGLCDLSTEPTVTGRARRP